MDLKERYEAVCNEYIDVFCTKHKLKFEGWIINEVGGVAWFGDELYFNFEDILIDIDNNIKENLIIEWFYENLDEKININYYSYTKGLRVPKQKK